MNSKKTLVLLLAALVLLLGGAWILYEKLGSQMEKSMIPYERAEGMKAFQKTIRDCSQLMPGSRIGIFIGPEGGFDEMEIKAALAAGVQPVSLGKRILRTETAGLCVLSALMLELEAASEQ